jgi:hypothetical protein
MDLSKAVHIKLEPDPRPTLYHGAERLDAWTRDCGHAGADGRCNLPFSCSRCSVALSTVELPCPTPHRGLLFVAVNNADRCAIFVACMIGLPLLSTLF